MCMCYLVLLLCLFAEVATVGVVLDDVLAHIVHSVHQKLKALLQVVAVGIHQSEGHNTLIH